MLPAFLIPENEYRADGESEPVELGPAAGKLLKLTLVIHRIIEQESLDVEVWGSPDGQDWGTKPLLAFPQKFYCGTYCLLLDLSKQPEIRFLKGKWKMNRWGRGTPKPLFGFCLFAEECSPELVAVAKR